MANPEHVEKLLAGVEAWKEWRSQNPALTPSLSRAKLSGADLRWATLTGADLREADLREADLGGAFLDEANLVGADLMGADLREANLYRADLSGASLYRADLGWARFGATKIGNADLREVEGLESVLHQGPSSVGIDTFFLSKGKIPDEFLRGAGVPDVFIEYAASLVGKPFDFYSCFISYSTGDEDLAMRLHSDLQSKGVRCWFAPEDLRTGDKFRVEIDEAIRVCDRLLLLLSEHSVASDWVEKEVETAMERERQQKRTMLFPIRLDDAVMKIERGWPADIRRNRHIGDFTQWKDHDAYQRAFERLLRDLKAPENGAPTPTPGD